MKNYLVPYDGSNLANSALRHAIEFARHVPGRIDVTYIADERVLANPVLDITVMALQGIGTLGDIPYRQKIRLELKAKLIARGEDLLEEVKGLTELSQEVEKSVEFATRVEVANPIKFLIDESANVDVIFMGLWGEMQKLKAGLWGSTSEAVIRKGECPVFLATSEYAELKSVIVGFDNLPRSRQALAWAGMIGENMKIPVRVVMSWSDEEWLETTKAQAKEITDSYDTEFTNHESGDRAAPALLEVSEANPDSLICMGAFGDQPIREFFLGSVAEEVLRASKSPVMLFK
jgi:nucleotide-binding universal stress UspA family protein